MSGAALVEAVCHEVGNLLAGARLLASVPGASADPRLGRALGRAGAFVALLPALVARHAPENAGGADAFEVLSGLRRGLEDADEARLRVELRSALDLPALRLDGQTLQHLLLALILAGLDEGVGEVRVSARAERGAVRLRVQGIVPGASPRHAAALALAVADAILRLSGGRAELAADLAPPGVELWVRCAE